MIATWPRRAIVLRCAPAFFLGVSAVLLLTVYMFQHIGGLEPCPLCVAQRYPHLVALGLGLVAVLFGRRTRVLLAALLGAIAIAYLVGAGYAAFHVGVEAGHFQSGCAGSGSGASSIEELRERILKAPLAHCDDVSWTLLGLSMAGWNGIVSLLLGIPAGYTAWIALLEARRRVR